MRRSLIRLLVMMPLLATLAGCGIIDYFFLPPPEDTAQELFEAGNDAMREKDYNNAVYYFTSLKDKYPFSPYTVEAELSLGDAYFLDEEYVLATDAYKEFETLHPRHDAMPYVLYQIGKSNLSSFISIDRPQDNIREALEYFNRLQEVYPGSEYAVKGQQHIRECRKLIAEHEIWVADFYWRTERYGSAYQRYVFVAENFKDIEEYQSYVQKRARLAYLKFQQSQAQEDREEREGSWKDHFDWL